MPNSVLPVRSRLASVYPPGEDSWLLLDSVRVAPGLRVLEIGAGTGIVAVAAARAGARVVATDVNRFALSELRKVALRDRLAVEVVRTDLARGLARFDRVYANPPYLPTRSRERDADRWTNAALDGGRDGCRVTARIVRELPQLLRPGGSAYLVVSSRQSTARLAEIRDGWRARGGSVGEVVRRQLEGERLAVWRFALGRRRPPTALDRRGRARLRGTGARPRSRRARRGATSPAPARGSRSAPGGASIRRRSPRGS